MSARPIEGAPGYREADRRTAGSGGPATVHEARVAAEERKSIPSLVRDLIDDGRQLVLDEIRLARAETRENLRAAVRSLTSLGVGIAFGLAALLTLAVAANMGLTVALSRVVDPETAAWLSPLLLAVIFGIVGWALVRKGSSGLSPRRLVPDQTLETLREEKEWLRRASH